MQSGSFKPSEDEVTEYQILVTDAGAVWSMEYSGSDERWQSIYRFKRLDIGSEKGSAFYQHIINVRPAIDTYWSMSVNLRDGTVENNCEIYGNHFPYINVTWVENGSPRRLLLDFGCDPEKHEALREHLLYAPKFFGVEDEKLPLQWGPTTSFSRRSD